MRASFGMVFTRLVLLAVMGLSVWGAVAVFGTSLELADKILWWVLLDVPFATALALFLATFTALDEKGRLLQDSWLYKLADSAKWIKGGKVKFCPTFWKVGLASLTVHLLASVIGAILFGLGYAFINYTAKAFMSTGIIIAMVLVIVAAVIVKNKIQDRRFNRGFALGPAKASKGLSSTFAGKAIKAAKDKICLTIEVAPSEENK